MLIPPGGTNGNAGINAARILCIEDEELFGAQVVRWLRRRGFHATHALTAAEGIAIARRDPPSVVLLWNLGSGISGLDACGELRQVSDRLTIVMLTARTDESDAVRALDAGADEYLLKPIDLEVLCARIRALLRMSQRPGIAYVRSERAHDANVVSCGPLSLHPLEQVAVAGSAEVRLTPSQARILARLMHAGGDLVSNAELWKALGFRGSARLDNLRFHVKELRKVLAPLGISIRTLIGNGYALESSEADVQAAKVP